MTNDYLANRYGRTKVRAKIQRRFWISVGAVLLGTFFVWSILVNFASPANLSANVQSFSVISAQQTVVTIQVANPTQRDGICAVQLLNKGFTVVGYREQAISGSLGKAPVLQVPVNTTNLGVSASVDRCWLK